MSTPCEDCIYSRKSLNNPEKDKFIRTYSSPYKEHYTIQACINYKHNPNYSKDNVLETAIQTYGIEAQEDMAIEECSELIQAILHNRRKRDSNISEEIADVLIMLEQLQMIHIFYLS